MLEAAEIGHEIDKETYAKAVPGLRQQLIDVQYKLSRSNAFSAIILMSGVSAAGKSETINTLLSWLDPRFIRTHAIGLEETDDQRLRPFMWRFWQELPPRGRIGIFFDHWYSQPMEQRTHREIPDAQFVQRLSEINRFERMLTEENVLLLKFYLHISKDQQRKRLKKLAADPATRWHVTDEDWAAVKDHKRRSETFEETFRLTSPGHAPWVVVESHDRRYRELLVAQTVHHAIEARLAIPKPATPVESAADVHIPPPDHRTVLATLDFKKRLPADTYGRELLKWQGRLALLSRDKRFSKKHSLIIAFEGVDAAGKGGTIRRVTEALDARLYNVVPIAKPTDEEAARPYLWRFWRHVPRRGHVTVFDRTWYGRVLVERVEGFASEEEWGRAYGEINDFESDLSRSGVTVVKFWLAISKQEQLRRFREREREPFKRFKITPEDWRNRKRWDAYEQAVSDMVARTSTDVSPWRLVEAEDKQYARVTVLRHICEQLESRLEG